ncbi:hypothetical protein CAPTEDRAFT_204876, partial [Capitella teleta]
VRVRVRVNEENREEEVRHEEQEEQEEEKRNATQEEENREEEVRHEEQEEQEEQEEEEGNATQEEENREEEVRHEEQEEQEEEEGNATQEAFVLGVIPWVGPIQVTGERTADSEVCSMIFGGEVSRMKVGQWTKRNQWIDPTQIEKISEKKKSFFQKMELMYGTSKGNKLVSTLVPKDSIKAMDILTNCDVRIRAGVLIDNHFIFPTLNFHLHVQGWSVTHTVCQQAGLDATLINATTQRGRISTINANVAVVRRDDGVKRLRQLDSGDQLTRVDAKMNPLVDSPATTRSKEKRSRPTRPCPFCIKTTTHLTRNLSTVHKDRTEVAGILNSSLSLSAKRLFKQESSQQAPDSESPEDLVKRRNWEFLKDAVAKFTTKEDNSPKYGLKNQEYYLILRFNNIMGECLAKEGHEAEVEEAKHFLLLMKYHQNSVFGDAKYMINQSRQERLRLPSRIPLPKADAETERLLGGKNQGTVQSFR